MVTGCAEIPDRGQLNNEPTATLTLNSTATLGQTFVARFDGLQGIQVWLEPTEKNQGRLYLTLRNSPEATEDLVKTELSLAQVTVPGFYQFTFPSLPDSYNRYFYFFLEIDKGDTASVGTKAGDSYLDGALYRHHQPLLPLLR